MMEPGEYCVYFEYQVPLRGNTVTAGNMWFLHMLSTPTKRFDVITEVIEAADEVIRTRITNDGNRHLLHEEIHLGSFVRNLSIDLN
jgi:hypothetical protein